MGTDVAWVLNLDADVELAARGRYAPTKRVVAAMAPHVARLRGAWLAAGDLFVDESTPNGSARGRRGIAFCPTPRAVALLERAGADVAPHPDVEVLRRVNSRAFSNDLGQTLPASTFATTLDAARAHLALDPVVSHRFRLKRAFGMAGRGQRVIDAAVELTRDDLAFLGGALDEGGVRIEPDVAIEREHGLHGMVAEDGSFELGQVVVQRSDARGAWLASERVASAQVADVADALRAEASRVAHALHAAGYFGPFGVDSFTYRDREGASHLVARSEINARYSMAFLEGFGRLR